MLSISLISPIAMLSHYTKSSFDCQSATKFPTNKPNSLHFPFISSGVPSQNYITLLTFKRFPCGYEAHLHQQQKCKVPLIIVNNFSVCFATSEHSALPSFTQSTTITSPCCPTLNQCQTLLNKFVLVATNKGRVQLHCLVFVCLCPAFPAAIATMPANVPLPLPTDQLNCRFQQQQTIQTHSPIVHALFFSHSMLSHLYSIPSTLPAAVTNKSTQPQTTIALHFIPLHLPTKINQTSPRRCPQPTSIS